MPYGIELTGSADKALAKLSRSQPKDAEAIEDAIEDLAPSHVHRDAGS